MILVDEYLKLLIKQYFNQPNATGEISLIANRYIDVKTVIDGIVDSIDVDTATGDMLDKLGDWVGMPRVVPGAASLLGLFGFDDNPDSETFGVGLFFDLFGSEFVDVELTDEQYRFFIKAKGLKNYSSSFMVSDERVTIQDVVSAMFNSEAYAIDNLNMTLTVMISENVSLSTIRTVQKLSLLPKPQGVQYLYTGFFVDQTFGFDDNPGSETFGVGKFATLII